jgi:class 3 adenylate cyclase
MRAALLLILLFPLVLVAQTPGQRHIIQLKDSLGKELSSGWRFANADDTAMARPEYDDSRWPEMDPEMPERKHTAFTGIGWFRLHFIADSALASGPVTIAMQHTGASEVYLDGRLLFRRGSIKGKDSSIYLDPQAIPVAFSLAGAGHHVLAVRYANWAGLEGGLIYQDEPVGFTMKINKAEDGIMSAYFAAVSISASMMLLTGIFGALFFLHLLFFLYNRSDKSNLWFSMFSLCISLLFLSPFLINSLSNPRITLAISSYSFLLLVAACFSLSGFLNALFSRRKARFFVVSVLCIAVAAVFLFLPDLLEYATIGLIALISLEAVYLIVRAVYRRVPGAAIIGAGLALLISLLLLIVVVAVTGSSIHIKSGSPWGFVLAAILCMAILSIPVSMSAYLARNFWALGRDLKVQLRQVQQLSEKTLEQEAEKQRMLRDRQQELEHEVALRTAEVMQQKEEIEQQHIALKAEKKKADDLLRNILPEEVADELKEYGSSAARLYERVTVLFTDFADFTQMSERMSPEALVAEIDHCFKAFDGIIDQYGLEKIKTVGDAYIAVAGLPMRNERHAQVVVDAALAIRDFMEERRHSRPEAFGIRLGVHSGPVVAGIVGLKKFAYDIWGDTVNTAARMEQHGQVGKVNISQASYELLRDEFACSYRGELEAKHKGKMGMYFAERLVLAVGM